MHMLFNLALNVSHMLVVLQHKILNIVLYPHGGNSLGWGNESTNSVVGDSGRAQYIHKAHVQC